MQYDMRDMASPKDQDSGGKMPYLQTIRGILEAVIVAALLWTGNSLIDLKTQTAVVQSQLLAIQVSLADIPLVKTENIKLRADVDQLKQEMAEQKKLRGFR